MRSILGFLGFSALLGSCGVRIVDGCDCFLIKAVALYPAASVGLCTGLFILVHGSNKCHNACILYREVSESH